MCHESIHLAELAVPFLSIKIHWPGMGAGEGGGEGGGVGENGHSKLSEHCCRNLALYMPSAGDP